MSAIQNNNKIRNLVVFLITIFILLFFTKSAFYNMNNLTDENEQVTEKRDDTVKELKKLQDIEISLNSGDKDGEIKQFMNLPDREDLIKYFHDYSEDVSNSGNELFIHSINFSKPNKGEIGFMEQKINLKVNVSNKNVLKAFLTKLTSKKSTYKFFITDLNFANDNRPGSYTLTIPLTLLYK